MLFPSNLIFMAIVFIFLQEAIVTDVDWANMFIAGAAAFGILYGILTVIAYSHTTNKTMLLCNIVNLIVSLLLNQFIFADIWNNFSGEYFSSFFSTQNLIFIWFILLLWQCIIRSGVWLKRIIFDFEP